MFENDIPTGETHDSRRIQAHVVSPDNAAGLAIDDWPQNGQVFWLSDMNDSFHILEKDVLTKLATDGLNIWDHPIDHSTIE